MKNQSLVPDERIIQKIFLIRDKKVMIDRDLAVLYGVETKRLKEAVRRNAARFPEDFMFEMTAREFELWRNENLLDDVDRMGLRYAPFCFTEQGVTMLSSVLNSDQAIGMNIRIIRVFTRMRELLMSHKDVLLKLEQVERQLMHHHSDIQKIFVAIKQLIIPPPQKSRRIGYIREEA